MTNLDKLYYNKSYLKDAIELLGDQIEDISTWSVYNDDVISDDISEIKELYEILRRKAVNLI